jgi:hypothetical protein
MAERSALFVISFVTIFIVLMSLMGSWLGAGSCNIHVTISESHKYCTPFGCYDSPPSNNGVTILNSYLSLVSAGLFNSCGFPEPVVMITSILNTIFILYITLSIIFYIKGSE